MTRPTLEVADILRAQGDRFLERYRSSFDFQQLKAFRAILRCRTAALGGHRDGCPSCGHQAISYNSCRNRHCPKCKTQARQRWLAARERELLTTSYFHVVFTVPHELNVLALENPRLFYDLLFTASAQTLLEIAIDRKHLGAEIGVISTLHTWGQNLLLHPHIHCAIPAGGLSPDHRQWVRPRYPFFLPVKVLSRVFRGKFLAGLKRLHRRHQLCCAGPVAALPKPRSDPRCRSNPIAHRVRRKRQRLPPSLLIENASVRDPAPPQQSAPRRFRSRLATNRTELVEITSEVRNFCVDLARLRHYAYDNPAVASLSSNVIRHERKCPRSGDPKY